MKMQYKILQVLLSAIFILSAQPSLAAGARLMLSPDNSSAVVGTTFVTNVVVATESELVNAVAVEVQYPVEYFKLVDAQPIGTAFPLAPVKPRIDATAGNVTYEAGAPGGFNGQTELLRLTWEVKKTGKAVIMFGPGSQLLRHSATADSVPLALMPGSFELVTRDESLPFIAAKDFLDETVWYSVPFVRMSWEPKPGATYSYLLSRLPNEVPDEVADEPIGDIKIATPEDGVFYFHLRECQNGVCGPTVTRRAMKDVTPPAAFTPLFGKSTEAYQGRTFVSFATTDATSGIDRYEVSEGLTGAWEVVASPYVLSGRDNISQIRVRAYDKAGNVREVSVDLPENRQTGNWWGIGIAVALLIVVILVMKLRSKKSHTRLAKL